MADGPLVVIVGPTASGKSALALDLAERYNGEIVCADSRTIYKFMDIGTAKPSANDRESIKHHLLDVIAPDERFSVVQFKNAADAAIEEIASNGKLPILVGGSGLYTDAVLYDYHFAGPAAKRDEINPRHLEQGEGVSRSGLRDNTLVIGLDIDKKTLEDRIQRRILSMFKDGLDEEAKRLVDMYGWHHESMKTYEPLRGYLEGREDEVQARESMQIKDRQLAKKQRTWFKRNKSIQWVTDPKQAVDLVTTFLNKTI